MLVGQSPYILAPETEALWQSTMVQNNQEPRYKCWASLASVCSFACTAHSFTCFALLTSLMRSIALIHLLACSLTPKLLGKWMIRLLFLLYFFSVLDHSVVAEREKWFFDRRSKPIKTSKVSTTSGDNRGRERVCFCQRNGEWTREC